MKKVFSYTLAAMLAVSATASQGQRLHRHARKHLGNRIDKLAPEQNTAVVAAFATAYVDLEGRPYEKSEAEACLRTGNCVVVGETTPTWALPPPPPKPTTKSKAPAQFIEKPSTTLSPPPLPSKATSKAPPPPASTQAKPAKSSSSTSKGSGVDREFPSGEIKCSEFPSEYGAVPINWLNTDGWSGLQIVPDFVPGAKFINTIATGIAGDSCRKGTFCSYACPDGYQKAHWPEAQGSTKQSVGGVYCNSNGYLELTRKGYKTLCQKGAGGVSIKNDLIEVVSTCRTDYPGTEAMVIPAIAQPGSTVEVTVPVSSKYYVWDNKKTSAQYYINPKGLGPADACVWTSDKQPKAAGNWAPLNLGVGQDDNGVTWIGLFRNKPTSQADLDFNVEITGDVSVKCSYKKGQFSDGSDGCTAAVKAGGQAVIRYY
ncbi:CAZyme family GH132 [Purpureocillium lilacinum]|uniref:CAZyme family GH132 n=1 Tax=Purpureocillium lilacinum TaxID=33203 RepID=A0ABR0BFP5_PURLI|nr:CAZyme family GH132 [Purpureocillium lilacinum]